MLNNREIRIAIIEDDEDDFIILSDYLKEIKGGHFTIHWCKTYASAIEKINARAYDIYFVDYRLGSNTGLDLLQEIKAEAFDHPIVLLTGKGNVDIDVKAMKFGATDYLVKSELNPEKLDRCIRYSLDRAKNLKELKAREKKYRNLFESSKDAVLIANEQLDLLEINEAASQLLACPLQSNQQRNLSDFIFNPEAKNRLLGLFATNGSIQDHEIELRNDAGEFKSCLLSMAIIDEEDGHRFVHGILHDISNLRKAEQANLQTQKLAANEKLMRTLAHEIRNPLNNIGLSVDHFILPMEDNPKNQNLVDIVQRNCVRINHIITELLNITNKAQDLSFEKHTLQEIMDESITMAIDRISLQKIRLEKDYPKNPMVISANKSKLIIAFTNIIINAVEAMNPGKGELKVALDTSEDHYLVNIKDNGIGIPAGFLPKLFEPFFTLKKNGTGLGLAACYAIIQSHKGDIKVESEVDKGTNFQISFLKNGIEH
jgi:PAS domain S-box-containing protein